MSGARDRDRPGEPGPERAAGDSPDTSHGAHARIASANADKHTPCTACDGRGTVRNDSDPTTPRPCRPCGGRGYTYDAKPDGTRKERMG